MNTPLKVEGEVMAQIEWNSPKHTAYITFEENGSAINSLSYSRYGMAAICACPALEAGGEFPVKIDTFKTFCHTYRFHDSKKYGVVYCQYERVQCTFIRDSKKTHHHRDLSFV